MSTADQNDQRFREASHLQAMEGNPLDAKDTALFAMFEREGWSPERRRAYMLDQAKAVARGLNEPIPAAE